ncbi:unnamed protein product [Lactuca virosa]|uniref:Uncharacterized protein n=1 Tax=Lactuca virosa TaxID=75947 RepID=A0AAU9M667_9ASTR|nr:unnamed protein product [Lactuca virosa]
MQKKELENCIEKKREEVESYLKEKEKSFEEEKKELEYISSLKETARKEAEQVNIEMKKLEKERKEIILDHERRDKEWAELNDSIQQLKDQRVKLEKQRELLHSDRQEILEKIEELKKLEDVKGVGFQITENEIKECDPNLQKRNEIVEINSFKNELNNNGSTPPLSAPFGWLKRCASTLLEQTQSNKKRKKQPDDITPRRDSTKETTVYIDKIIKIREVTSVRSKNTVENSQEGEQKSHLESNHTKKLKGQIQE